MVPSVILGKVESGTLRVGDKLTLIPTSKNCKAETIWIDDVRVNSAKPGENIQVRLSGVTEKEVQKGFVVCSRAKPLTPVKTILTQLMIMDLGTTGLLTAGYKCMLHCHTLEEECWIEKVRLQVLLLWMTHGRLTMMLQLVCEIDKKTGKPKKTPCAFVRQGSIANIILEVPQTMAVDTFKGHQQLGRFTLRDEGRTVAIGKILEINPSI
ncbi:Gspt1 [Symbiodinium sp. KB8]|nr:Gspt1 [Symbiodinium sp. KB8]